MQNFASGRVNKKRESTSGVDSYYWYRIAPSGISSNLTVNINLVLKINYSEQTHNS